MTFILPPYPFTGKVEFRAFAKRRKGALILKQIGFQRHKRFGTGFDLFEMRGCIRQDAFQEYAPHLKLGGIVRIGRPPINGRLRRLGRRAKCRTDTQASRASLFQQRSG